MNAVTRIREAVTEDIVMSWLVEDEEPDYSHHVLYSECGIEYDTTNALEHDMFLRRKC